MSLRFDIRHEYLFRKYLEQYKTIPNYKKVLGSMIKFSEMYLPLRKKRWEIGLFSQIDELNAWRTYRRARVYMNKRDLINTIDSDRGRRIIVTTRGHKVF
ncbi:hypothetical protein L6258_03255, partial [Candidatus Parcubacteria bacterium]|nr:hypothetical protein [Candidatus Parcubacteria bacterium]